MRTLLFIFFLSALSAVGQSTSKRLDSLINESKFSEALKEIDLLMAKKSADEISLRSKQAMLLVMQGKLEEAQTKTDLLLGRPNLDPYSKAKLISTKGYILLNRAAFDEAHDEFQKALGFYNQADKSNSLEAAQCLSYLATLFYSTGKTKQAEENQLMSLQIRQKLFLPNHPEIAAAYNDLGLVYSRENPEKALDYYEMASKIYQKIYGPNHVRSAIASSNIGFMYRKMELYGDAVNNFETALAIWKKLYPDGHPNQASVLAELGATYFKLKNFKAGKSYYQQAVNQYKKSYGRSHPDLAAAFNQLGVIYRSDEKYDSALFYYQQALMANAIGFGNGQLETNPKANSYYNGFILLYSMIGKAGTLEEKYLNKTIKQKELMLALKCLQVADSVADLLRQNSRDENDKIALGGLANEVYEDGVRISHLLSEVTVKPSYYKEVAFYFAEKSKSAVLLESIADANAKSFSGIPQDLVEKEKSLKADIALYSQKLAQKPDAAQEQELRKKLFDLNSIYGAFVKKLETDYPEYFNLKFNNASPTTFSIQALLPEQTAVVSYFIAEKGKRLYTFVLSKSKFKIGSKPLPEKLDRLLKGFTNSIFYSNPSVYFKTGNELSLLLDPNVGGTITDLIIIPSGRLGTLPFEALPKGKVSQTDQFGNPCWVHSYSIGYEFSTALLAQKSKRKSGSSSSIFLCAPIKFSVSQNLGELPGTEAEVNFIAGLFGKNALLKKSGDATETMVKQTSLKDYKYIHFATHGIVDEQSPELSRIFLKESPTDDGDLFSGEIYNLTLNADMVALSACQTGLGKVSKGEGVIGLSRALVYAGARNIMVSYWSVSDESTSQLMAGFYQNVLSSTSPSYRKNLQQVKIKMINEKKYAAPFYWAPFVLIGF
jgi:CHAT domain-containing protein